MVETNRAGASLWDRYNPAPDTAHIRNRRTREREILNILDEIGFNWPVFVAVSMGFLASSYTIFSSNIITPALRYVYPTKAGDPYEFQSASLVIDMVTIGTTTVGMMVFGHLADRLGRKRLYGLELIIIILGTVGMIQTSDGYSNGQDHSLDVYAAIASWRGIQGLGIGAEYPVSAVISAEFSSTETRGTLMASLFAMQSLGRLLAYAVTLGSLETVHSNSTDHRVTIDKIWRLVVGISAVPAIAAIGLRFTIPETPRFYTGIKNDLKKAVQAVEKVGGRPDDLETIHSDIQPSLPHKQPKSSWYGAARDYLFGQRKGWKVFLAVALQWLLLDVNFYGLGLDSPSTLHRLWLSETPASSMNCTFSQTVERPQYAYTTATLTLQDDIITTITQMANTVPTATTTAVVSVTSSVSIDDLPPWNEDIGNLCASIDETLDSTADRTLLLSSISSIAGALLSIVLINRYTRRNLLAVTCGLLCVLFFASGISVKYAAERPTHAAGMVFFALTQFVFNLGPNTLIFIIAAESFPTVFRGSFHGLAAAIGKVGALIIRPIIGNIEKNNNTLSTLLFVFCAVQLIMAVIALIPGAIVDAQYENDRSSLEATEGGYWKWLLFGRLHNKSLEEIAPNPESLFSNKAESMEMRPPEVRDVGEAREGESDDTSDVPPLRV